MAGESYRETNAEQHEEELSQEELESIDAAVGEVAYEVWQENGRDENYERLIERMNLEYAEQHRDKPREEQPGWAMMVTDLLESRKN